jgi:hypothetical protein
VLDAKRDFPGIPDPPTDRPSRVSAKLSDNQSSPRPEDAVRFTDQVLRISEKTKHSNGQYGIKTGTREREVLACSQDVGGFRTLPSLSRCSQHRFRRIDADGQTRSFRCRNRVVAVAASHVEDTLARFEISEFKKDVSSASTIWPSGVLN